MSPRPKKKKDLENEISELKASLEDENKKADIYLNQLKYAKADLENLQKRMQQTINDTVERANSRILLQLLPIVDELELAINATKGKNEKLLEGIKMVKKKLEKLLETEGVNQINALGASFDPNLHEAVLEVEDLNHPDGCIIEELRKGYSFKGRILRASMVKVARNSSSNENQGEDIDE